MGLEQKVAYQKVHIVDRNVIEISVGVIMSGQRKESKLEQKDKTCE